MDTGKREYVVDGDDEKKRKGMSIVARKDVNERCFFYVRNEISIDSESSTSSVHASIRVKIYSQAMTESCITSR